METADLSHHISRRFNEDLERVRSKVLGMGGFVEQQLQKAITALVEGDSSLGESVALDDHQVNNMEIAIDEECMKILATRAPAGLRRALQEGNARALAFDLRRSSPFERAVLGAALEIPRGEIRSYSWIAQRIDRPLRGNLHRFARHACAPETPAEQIAETCGP